MNKPSPRKPMIWMLCKSVLRACNERVCSRDATAVQWIRTGSNPLFRMDIRGHVAVNDSTRSNRPFHLSVLPLQAVALSMCGSFWIVIVDAPFYYPRSLQVTYIPKSRFFVASGQGLGYPSLRAPMRPLQKMTEAERRQFQKVALLQI